LNTRWTDADLDRFTQHVSAGGKLKDFLRTPARRKARQLESKEQQFVIRWWATACHGYSLPEHILMANPLGGYRTKETAARLKAEGARAGTPDLFLAVMRGGAGGLWIEMKTPTGRVEPEQAIFMNDLLAQGYQVKLCRSAPEAIGEINNYLRPTK
jgi:hypothetical protein